MALNVPNKQNKPFGIVTVSVGVTTGHASTAQNITAYLQRADEALYMSKQKGGNCHTCLSFEEEADKQ
jgi:PleD family two-component response regulator